MMQVDKLRDCPVLKTIDAIGGKWRTRILWKLREGPAHFGEIQRTLGISEKVLTENLKALEREDIILRSESSRGNVVKTACAYSAYGQSLIPVLDSMGHWGINHMALKGELKTLAE